MLGVAHTFPFRVRPGLSRVGEAWYGKSGDSVVRTVAGWVLGSELTDTSCKQSGSEESEPWDRAAETLGGGTPPRATFGGDCESQGGPERQASLSGETWAQSAPTRWMSGKRQGLTRRGPQPSPAVKLVPWGTAPTCGQTSPPERRLLLRRDGIHRMAVGQSLQARAQGGSPPPPCGEWGKTLQSPSEAHQKSQARRTPYTGSECGKAFGWSAHLAQHWGVHTGAKPHACMECGKAFGRLTHLSQHRRVHTGEKPYACGECGKASRRSTHLSQRGWTHTGERPCTCDACGQAFSQSTRLTQHQCVHTAEKP